MEKETVMQQKRRLNQSKRMYERYGEEVIKYMWSVHKFLLNKFGYISDEWFLSLQMLADNLNMFFKCRDQIAEDGIFIENKFGNLDKHPLIKVQNDAQIQIVKLLNEFGLSPKSVARLKIEDTEEDDLLNDLLND